MDLSPIVSVSSAVIFTKNSYLEELEPRVLYALTRELDYKLDIQVEDSCVL
jgi:hypothetical protein